MGARLALAAALVLLAVTGVASIVPIRPALAATFTVNSAVDEPDATPGDGQCISTPAGACTLRAAIMEANGLGGSHTITLPAGTFTLTRAGANEDAGLTGDLDIFANLTITGAGASNTIIDGNQLDRVFHGQPGVTSLAISQLTITNASGEALRTQQGTLSVSAATITRSSLTGIYSTSATGGSVTVTNSTITANGRSGLTVTGADNTVASVVEATVVNSTISDNTEVGIDIGGYGNGSGGNTTGTFTVTGSTLAGNAMGINGDKVILTDSTISASVVRAFIGIGISAKGDVLVTNSQITRNAGIGISGNALVTLRSSQVTENSRAPHPIIGSAAGGVNAPAVVLEHSVVSRNQNGGNAGGILAGNITVSDSRIEENSGAKAGGVNAAGTAALTNSIVSGNSVTNAGGVGGIRAVESVELTNSTVSGNTGTVGGGLDVSRQATVTRSTIANNTASTIGGGVHLNPGATLTLLNSTISNNTAPTGGGIAQAGEATLRLTNSTVANNTAGTNGSGVYKLGGTAEFRNMIVASNTGSPNCFFATPITTLGNNLASDGSCAFSGPNDRNSTDAKLGPLANNGGPTKTHALLSGSPAVDFGNPDGCPATDQRGIARPQDGDGSPPASCDIGAFEAAEGSSPSPSSCSPRPPVRITSAPDGAGRLRVTVSTSGIGGALSRIRLGAASNAQIDAPGGPPSSTGNFEVTPPSGATSYTFTVRRVTAGQGIQVPFIAVDACGNWPTFVGGGPSAF